MQIFLQRLKQHAVPLLLTVVILQFAVIVWFVLQPEDQTIAWQSANGEMAKALNEVENVSPPANSGVEALPTIPKAKTNSASNAPEKSTQPQNGLLDLNTATLEQLDTLPGIGPSKARAILELRQQIGRFSTVEQLLDVKGIGPSTLAKFRDRLYIAQTGK